MDTTKDTHISTINPLQLTRPDGSAKVAVVTGGTRGIGFSIVETFLKNGAKVALLGSRTETVDAALEKLAPEYEGKVLGFHPDLTSKSEMTETFEEIAEKFGTIDILVNNAGVASSTKFADFTEDEYDKIANLNIKSLYIASQAALPYLKESKGVILNTSSMVSLHGQPAGFMYPASKFAVNGITLSLARELAPEGIRVNAVAPGVIATDMVKNLPEGTVDQIIKTIPLGRVGTPEDIANAFLFLASDLASYISGTVLSVDGLARS